MVVVIQFMVSCTRFNRSGTSMHAATLDWLVLLSAEENWSPEPLKISKGPMLCYAKMSLFKKFGCAFVFPSLLQSTPCSIQADLEKDDGQDVGHHNQRRSNEESITQLCLGVDLGPVQAEAAVE